MYVEKEEQDGPVPPSYFSPLFKPIKISVSKDKDSTDEKEILVYWQNGFFIITENPFDQLRPIYLYKEKHSICQKEFARFHFASTAKVTTSPVTFSSGLKSASPIPFSPSTGLDGVSQQLVTPVIRAGSPAGSNPLIKFQDFFSGFCTTTVEPEQNGTRLCIQRAGYELIVSSAENKCFSVDNRENYFPVAFRNQGDSIIQGGAYLSISYFSANTQRKRSLPIPNQLKKAITGICLLGVLEVVDEQGRIVNILSSDLTFPPGFKGKEVKAATGEHLYETITKKTFENLVPLIKVLGDEVRLAVQIPVDSYILSMIQFFLDGILSEEAVDNLSNIIIDNGHKYYDYWKEYVHKYSIVVEIILPFVDLGLCYENELAHGKKKNKVVEKFLKMIGLEDKWEQIKFLKENQQTSPEYKEIKANILARCIDFLAKKNSATGRAWQSVKEQVMEGNLELKDLQDLGKHGYPVGVLITKDGCKPEEVCILNPHNEKRVPVVYSKFYARKYGRIPWISWLHPAYVHLASCKKFLFNMKKKEAAILQQVFAVGQLSELSFQAIGAIALNSQSNLRDIARIMKNLEKDLGEIAPSFKFKLSDYDEETNNLIISTDITLSK